MGEGDEAVRFSEEGGGESLCRLREAYGVGWGDSKGSSAADSGSTVRRALGLESSSSKYSRSMVGGCEEELLGEDGGLLGEARCVVVGSRETEEEAGAMGWNLVVGAIGSGGSELIGMCVSGRAMVAPVTGS